MNYQKCTEKSLAAIQSAQSLAGDYQNPEMTQIHLLYALCSDENALLPQILRSMEIDDAAFGEDVKHALEALPRQTGGSLYMSGSLSKALDKAEKIASKMNDEYTSVEHLFLGILDEQEPAVKKLFSTYGITEQRFLSALKKIRGNSRVTSENPEGTYNVLEKYGQDLVKLARQRKLDPVIGRDEEIRRVIRILSRKTKNNPCLIGEPGVGKTAIAEGLALRIVRGDVPDGKVEAALALQ